MVWVRVNGDSEVITNTIYSKLGSVWRATPGRFDSAALATPENPPAYDGIEYVEPATYDTIQKWYEVLTGLSYYAILRLF